MAGELPDAALWQNADPALQPRVRAARETAALLQARAGAVTR